MPERFVVRLVAGAQNREALGVPSPTISSSAPTPNSSNRCSSAMPRRGRLKPDARLAWLFDFDAAVSVGLAVRIPLDPAWLRTGIDRVVVLGLKLSADPMESAALVEPDRGPPPHRRFRHPAAGHAHQQHGEGARRLSSDPRPTPDTYRRIVKGEIAEIAPIPEDRTDAEQLATALGIDFAAVNALSHATLQDVTEAFAMNRALWSATIGGYLEKLIPSALSPSLDTALRGFFLDHVSGRGTGSRGPRRAPASTGCSSPARSGAGSGAKRKRDGIASPRFSSPRSGRPMPTGRATRLRFPRSNSTIRITAASWRWPGCRRVPATYAVRKGVTDLLAWNWLQPFAALGAVFRAVLGGAADRPPGRPCPARFDLAQEDLKLAEIAFLRRVEQLDGPVIDGDPELPLSEKDTITPFDPVTKQNYIHWLATAAPEATSRRSSGSATARRCRPRRRSSTSISVMPSSPTPRPRPIGIARLKVPALGAFATVPAEPDIVNVGRRAS